MKGKTSMLQVRVDEKLKQQASEIYEAMGIDLSTAVRMFLLKSVEAGGIPFRVAAVEPEDVVTKSLPAAAAKKTGTKAPKAAAPKASKEAKKPVASKPTAAKKTSGSVRNVDMSWD